MKWSTEDRIRIVKEFKMRDKIKKKKRRGKHVKQDNPKYTLNEIGDALFEFIKTTNTRFDNLDKDVNSLKQDVKDINTRLDYNDLKQLPNNK